jgi:hypothetical protein
MNFSQEYSSKFEVWLPSLVDTSYVVTPFHNSNNSSIKGAYMFPYLHPSQIFFHDDEGQHDKIYLSLGMVANCSWVVTLVKLNAWDWNHQMDSSH